jgi:hypothetical protein
LLRRSRCLSTHKSPHTFCQWRMLHSLVNPHKLLVYEALNYQCMRPWATSVWGLKLLVYEAKKKAKNFFIYKQTKKIYLYYNLIIHPIKIE